MTITFPESFNKRSGRTNILDSMIILNAKFTGKNLLAISKRLRF
jgi:hypothetical protein